MLSNVGADVGDEVTLSLGPAVGTNDLVDGIPDGWPLEVTKIGVLLIIPVGKLDVGLPLGVVVGDVGTPLGIVVGDVGTPLGIVVGDVGTPLGFVVGNDDTPLGKALGFPVGKSVWLCPIDVRAIKRKIR